MSGIRFYVEGEYCCCRCGKPLEKKYGYGIFKVKTHNSDGEHEFSKVFCNACVNSYYAWLVKTDNE